MDLWVDLHFLGGFAAPVLKAGTSPGHEELQ